MRKFIVRAIPIFALALFVFVMLSDTVLKKSITTGDDIPSSIEQVIDDIKEDKWEYADRNTKILAKAWEKVAGRVQFSAEKDEIDDINISIARLRGAIQAKDKTNALMELQEAYEHWTKIGR